MADTVITATKTSPGATGLKSELLPVLVTGSYVANDTDYHAMTFATQGKRYMTYVVDNPSDKDVVVTIYGSPSPVTSTAGKVGDPGVFLIGTSETSTAGGYVEATTDEGAMYYIIRCKSAATPDGSTVRVYAHMMP
jgi:hypothetical protein